MDDGDRLKTHRHMIRNAKHAFKANEAVFGVKGPTQLVELPYFDLAAGFVVDNLHCIDLGVARNLSSIQQMTSSHGTLETKST